MTDRSLNSQSTILPLIQLKQLSKMDRLGILAAIAGLVLVHLASGTPTPVRPKPSESFSAEYTRVGLGTEWRGSIYRNFKEGKQFQVEQLGAQNGVVNTLTRVDLQTKYKYIEPYGFCSQANGPNIEVVPAWTWIENAEYVGLKVFNRKRVNIWAYNDTQNGIYNEIGVSVKDANVPVFVFEESSKPFEVTVFHTFTKGPASSSKFDIPNIQCFEE